MLSCIVFEKMEHLSRLSRWHTEKYILAAARSNLQLKQIPSTFHLEKTQRDQISARFVISERRDLRETEKKQENRQTGWDLSNNGDRVFLEKTESGKIKGMWTVNKTRLGVKSVNKESPWSRSIQQDVAFANKILSSVCNYIWSPHKVICQEIAWAIQNQMHNQWLLITQIIASFTNIPLWTKILPGDRNTIVIRAPMIEFIDWQWGCPPKDLPQTFVSKTLCMQKSHHQLSKKSSSLGDTPRYRPNVPWARFLQEKGGGGKGGAWTSKIMVMVIMIKYTSYLPQQ